MPGSQSQTYLHKCTHVYRHLSKSSKIIKPRLGVNACFKMSQVIIKCEAHQQLSTDCHLEISLTSHN